VSHLGKCPSKRSSFGEKENEFCVVASAVVVAALARFGGINI